ncbi:hypothetical protein LX81_00625 [Palleronia aestuarii]|uniref:Uncharacterized protein n=1 Tax=Palleronia aestuarii TaxID=568105 RepID=A0A2W7NES0_9RHOB|nr:hypothetical protein LX81_00625 [Palleronia aestuarii]
MTTFGIEERENGSYWVQGLKSDAALPGHGEVRPLPLWSVGNKPYCDGLHSDVG